MSDGSRMDEINALQERLDALREAESGIAGHGVHAEPELEAEPTDEERNAETRKPSHATSARSPRAVGTASRHEDRDKDQGQADERPSAARGAARQGRRGAGPCPRDPAARRAGRAGRPARHAGARQAYADDDPKAVARARDAEDAALRRGQELNAQLAGANIRVERAQADVDRYLREHAEALLDERAAVAEQVTHDLVASVHETLRLHRALIDECTEMDRVLAGSGASPRLDGPEPTHPWEQALSTLDRVVRETPTIDPPTPRWLGRREAAERERVARLLREQRQG